MSAFTSSSLRSLLRAAPRAATPARSFTSSAARSTARMNITGRLGSEPELFNTAGGREYVKYVVASSSGPKDNRVTSWFRVAAFVSDSQREFILNLPKGALVCVDAEAVQRRFQDGDGKEHLNLSLSQRSIEVLSRPLSTGREEHSSGKEEAETPSE
ncbi:hypothetical protein BDW62DRAFT_185241 [Aspergillus aurantiobrunneus]